MLIKFCKNCKYSISGGSCSLSCIHPILNINDPFVLSLSDIYASGTNTTEERKKTWFGKCGIKGKLYEPKDVTTQ